MTITPKQRQFLKQRAHELKPIVQIGHKGISDGLVQETRSALLAHELVKVKLPEGEGDALADELAARLQPGGVVDLVTVLGRTAVLYAPHPEKPRLRLPREPSRGAPAVADGDGDDDGDDDAP